MSLLLLFSLNLATPGDVVADTHDGAGYIYQSPERRRLADKADRAKLIDAQGIAATIREQFAPKAPKPVPKVSVAFDFEADDEEALLWLI